MAVEISWRSRQGRRTDANQDYCGVALRPDAVLCVVLDGSTARQLSGELVRLIARDLIDWFILAKKGMAADDVINQLHEIHKFRSKELHWASASYLVALIEHEKPTHIFYAGDCLVGRLDAKAPIEWLIRPHTLANAIETISLDEIASSTLRNKLTRSFRAKEFMAPDIATITDVGKETFVVATDGFWAELKHDDQCRFLEGEAVQEKENQDDCSALKIRILGSDNESQVSTSTAGNLYVVESD